MSKAGTNGSQAPTTDKFQGGRSSTRWLTATALTVTALIVSVTIASATPTKPNPQTPSSADTKTTLTTSNGTKVTPLGSGLVAVSQPIWNNDYPLGRSGQGVVGVHADKTQTPKPHLYGLQANLGNTSGWWIWLTGGSPDDQYISGAVEWTYKSPGATRLKTAVLDFSARPKIYRADHCSELGLRTLPSSSSAAQTIDSLRECNPPEDVPEVDGWQTRTLTFQDPAANPTSKELFFRLEFPACKNPPTNGEPSCSKHIPELDPLTNGFAARMDRLEMILVDDDLPTVTPSGEFYALKDTYIDGKGTYDLKIDAADRGAGIKQIGFDHQGNAITEGANGALGTIHDHASPCDPAHNTQSLDNRICPQADATATTVDTNPMPEGNNSFEAWAKDPAENKGTSSFKVKIDRTPPPAPPNPKFLTPEDGIAQIGWDESVDPALIDATPGSGTVSYRVRYAQDFTPFSDWKTYPADARVSDWTPEYPIGTWVTLEVVAVDAVGNVSPVSTAHGQVIALPPVVTASGAFYDLDDEYINGHGTYAARVSAVDTGSGVRSVSVHEYMVGDQMTSLAPCTTDLLLVETCPKEYGADFSVSTTGLAEGAHVFVGKAVDRLGAVGSTEGTRVLVDRTAPSTPTFEAVYFAEFDTTELSWSPADDADLSDGTPGSGTESVEYAIGLDGGGWSSWQIATTSRIQLLGYRSSVQVKARSVDQVGNMSEVETFDIPVSDSTADEVLPGTGSEFGTVTIYAFLDSNGDGLHEPGEASAKGLRVEVAGEVKITSNSGVVVLAVPAGTHELVLDAEQTTKTERISVKANANTSVTIGVVSTATNDADLLRRWGPVAIMDEDDGLWPTRAETMTFMSNTTPRGRVIPTQFMFEEYYEHELTGPTWLPRKRPLQIGHFDQRDGPFTYRFQRTNQPWATDARSDQIEGFQVAYSKLPPDLRMPNVYSYVRRDPSDPDHVVLVYWFYFTYNYFERRSNQDCRPSNLLEFNSFCITVPWHETGTVIGEHEGDWERVVVSLRDGESSPPAQLYLSRHGHHRTVDWSSIEKNNDAGELHPVVHIAEGSHAVYARCGIHRRPLPDEAACPYGDYAETRYIFAPFQFPGRGLYSLGTLPAAGLGCWPGRWGRPRSPRIQDKTC